MDRSFVIGDYAFNVCKYYGGGICIQVYVEYEPFCTLTVNVSCYGIKLKENEFVVNHDLLNNKKFIDLCLKSINFEDTGINSKKFIDLCLKSDYFDDTGKTVNYKYCKGIPVWRLKGEWLD